MNDTRSEFEKDLHLQFMLTDHEAAVRMAKMLLRSAQEVEGKVGYFDLTLLEAMVERITTELGQKISRLKGEDPEPSAPKPRVVHDLLSLVAAEIKPVAVPDEEWIESNWDADQRRRVAEWAGAVHLAASDNDIEIPPKPEEVSPHGGSVPSQR